MTAVESDKWINWKGFRSQLVKRVREPIQYPGFFIYFLIVLVIMGGLGVWITLFRLLFSEGSQDWELFSSSLSTYALPIMAAAFGDLILAERPIRSVQIFAYGIAILGAICAVVGMVNNIPYVCVFGVILALFLWWFANSENANLIEPTPPATAPTGGDVEKQELKGDTSEFQV